MDTFLMMAAAAFTGCLLTILAAWCGAALFGFSASRLFIDTGPVPRAPKSVMLGAVAIFSVVFAVAAMLVSGGSMHPGMGGIALLTTLVVLMFATRQFRKA